MNDSPRGLVASVEAEFRRYRALADAAMDQVADSRLSAAGPHGGSSIAVIAWHVGGNLTSRFTDFLDTDGEKSWRDRDDEFAARTPTRAELAAQWNRGWSALFDTLTTLADDDLSRSVTIRRQPLRVHEALHRALAHISYHVGQIVYVAKAQCGDAWTYLSIPPGGSAAYNRGPTFDRPDAHASELTDLEPPGLDDRP